MGRRQALVIGNSAYDDQDLARLKSPALDAHDFAGALQSPDIGAFDEVAVLFDATEAAARRAIARLFAAKKPDDLLLLYFSGHGVRDEQGDLYLAVKDTERSLLAATAVPAAFITEQMNLSRSKRQVLVLDCCNSGAFARGTKAATGGSMGTATAFEGTGYGRVVLTATDSTQYAWEGDQLIGEAANSVFTHFLVEGMETGRADANGDGAISLDELYEYAYDQVVVHNPKQTPGKWSYRQQGDIILAKNPHLAEARPGGLPPELTQALASPLAGVREGALRELAELRSNPALTDAATLTLRRVAETDDSRRVAGLAAEMLGERKETKEREREVQPVKVVAAVEARRETKERDREEAPAPGRVGGAASLMALGWGLGSLLATITFALLVSFSSFPYVTEANTAVQAISGAMFTAWVVRRVTTPAVSGAFWLVAGAWVGAQFVQLYLGRLLESTMGWGYSSWVVSSGLMGALGAAVTVWACWGSALKRRWQPALILIVGLSAIWAFAAWGGDQFVNALGGWDAVERIKPLLMERVGEAMGFVAAVTLVIGLPWGLTWAISGALAGALLNGQLRAPAPPS